MIGRSLFDLSGTAAIITGSSRGIGLAIARHFLAQGASVVVSGHDSEETARARDALIGETGDVARVVGCAVDVSAAGAGDRLSDAAMSHFGRLDTVVCNAGIDIIKPAIDYTPEDWNRILAVNLGGAFAVAQAAARRWIADNTPGAVVMTSSIAGRVGISGLAPYAASKGGIDQLVRTLAVEWARHGIRVNAVAPGYVDNVMTGVTVHADPETEARIRRFTPLGRRASVDEIAAPCVFLASPAAAYVTGAVLMVDGGYTAQ